jgi:hypothetical protein
MKNAAKEKSQLIFKSEKRNSLLFLWILRFLQINPTKKIEFAEIVKRNWKKGIKKREQLIAPF